MSPSFVEQYVIAARLVALQAVGRPDARAGSKTYSSGPGTQQAHVPGLPLGTRGGVLAEHYFPSDGTYEVNVADMIGGLWGNDMEFENTMVVTLDGKLVHEVTVGGEEDMKRFDQIHNGALDAINIRLKNIRFQATAGPHKVGVAFRHRTFAESDDRKELFVPGGGQDRVFRVSSFQISGPFEPSGLSDTPSRAADLQLPSGSRAASKSIAPRRSSRRIATQAFRRPLDEGDLTELLRFYRARPHRRRVRGRGSQRAHRHSREPELPVPRRARSAERRPPARPTRSTTSSSRRSCRSSCGTRSRTTSCASSRCAASSASRTC